MIAFIASAVLLGVLFGGYELLRRSKILTAIMFVLIPLIMTPFWMATDHRIFLWLKLYSVIGGVLLLALLRHTTLSKYFLLFTLIYLALVLNIGEALVVDIMNFKFFNGIAGILLIVTLPGIKKICIDAEGRQKDLLWDIPFTWILGYTVWNWVFVVNTFPQAPLRHLAILGVPFMVACFHRKVWIQVRAYTLGIYLILYFSLPEVVAHTALTWTDTVILSALNIFSFGWMVVYTYQHFHRTGGMRLEKNNTPVLN